MFCCIALVRLQPHAQKVVGKPKSTPTIFSGGSWSPRVDSRPKGDSLGKTKNHSAMPGFPELLQNQFTITWYDPASARIQVL